MASESMDRADAQDRSSQNWPSLSDPPKMTPLLTATSYPAALWSGKDLRFRWANTPFLRLLGVPPRFDALGMPVRGFLSDTAAATKFLDAAYTGQPQIDPEYEHIAVDGRVSYWHLTFHPVPAGIGDPYDVLVSAVDVTMRAQARHAAEEDTAELVASKDLIDTTILSSMDAEEILQRIVVEATEAFGADWGWIAEREPGAWVFRSVHGWPGEIVGMSFREDDLSLPRLAADARAVVSEGSRGAASADNRLLMERHDIGAFLLIPIMTRGEVTGVLGFCWSHYAALSPGLLDLAHKLEVSLSLALENARVYEAERRVSHTLQSSYFAVPSVLDGLEIGHLYHSASAGARVGGDFYDVVQTVPGLVSVIIGEVDGRGIEAAARSLMLKNALRSEAVRSLPPDTVVARTNHLVRLDPTVGQNASAFCGLLNTGTGEMRYCSAGHAGPVVARPGLAPYVLNGAQDVLGARADTAYAMKTARIELGDLVVFYSDGLTNATDHRGEAYGAERLMAAVANCGGSRTASVPEAIFMDVFSHARGSIDDDVAILAMRRVA